MAESSSSPQPNQPPRPRQNQPAKKGNPLGCLLPLGVAAFFFAQQYLPSWSWAILVGFIFVAIVSSSANNAKKKRQRAGYQPGVQSAPQAQQGGPQIASTQFPPPPQPQPRYQPQYVAPPPPPPQQQVRVQRPQPQPVPQPRPQPRQAQPQQRPQQRPQAQPQPRPRMQPVPGTEHLAPALIGRVTDLKLKGQTVEAIETLREATAMELYEASQIVRRLGQPAKDPAVDAVRDLDSDDFGDLDAFDTSDPYEKADAELERKWKQADEEMDRAWQRELKFDNKKWTDD